MSVMASMGTADVAELEELSRQLEDAERALPTLRMLVAIAIAEARRRAPAIRGVRGR